MLGKGLVTTLGRSGGVGALNRRVGVSAGACQPAVYVPKRTWAQVGHVISTPPRIHVSFGEKVAHGIFMYVVWLGPTLWGLSQVKVWRRRYVEE